MSEGGLCIAAVKDWLGPGSALTRGIALNLVVVWNMGGAGSLLDTRGTGSVGTSVDPLGRGFCQAALK
jgi:hypothetical protein